MEQLAKRYGPYAFLAVLFVVVLGLTVHVTTRKGATHLETGLWEFILFAVGVVASFYIGQRSVTKAAHEIVRPQARSALRRLVSLGKIIGTARAMLDEQGVAAAVASENGDLGVAQVELAFKMIDLTLENSTEQVVAAIEDWREFTPDIVNELVTSSDHE